jgi:hypothetical protein
VGKIVFWLVVVFVGLFAVRLYNAAKTRKRSAGRSKGPPPPQLMVRCVQCGVYLPEPEARATDTGYRCRDPACATR